MDFNIQQEDEFYFPSGKTFKGFRSWLVCFQISAVNNPIIKEIIIFGTHDGSGTL